MSELRARGLIRLTPRPGRTGVWLLPLWAVLCGALASSTVHPSLTDGVRLLLVGLLVEGGWGTLWSALATTDWATPLQRWRDWPAGAAVPLLPYARPGAPAERLALRLSQLRSWWRDAFAPTAGPALGEALVGLALSAFLALALGPEMLLLTLGAIALMELAAVRAEGRGTPPGGWDAILRMGLPWLAGHLAFGALTLPSIALAGGFTLAVAGATGDKGNRSKSLWIVGQLLTAILFVLLRRPVAAAFLVLFLLPQWALLVPSRSPSPIYHRALPWLGAAMLLAAWAV